MPLFQSLWSNAVDDFLIFVCLRIGVGTYHATVALFE